MTGDQERGERYRDVALKLGHLARQTRHPDAERRLLALAERFERMADDAEHRHEIER